MLIAISGKAGSGKDTVAEMLSYFINNNESEYSFGGYQNYIKGKSRGELGIIAFADSLKWMLSEFLECSIECFFDRDFKLKEIPWLNNITTRELMQRFGTAMRKEFGEDIWCKQMFHNFDCNEEDWIISDLRYKNELEYIQKFNPVIIRISRGGVELSSHQSETDLDDYGKWNYVIKNNSTLEDLYKNVYYIFTQIYK